jgi:hypothetical protein
MIEHQAVLVVAEILHGSYFVKSCLLKTMGLLWDKLQFAAGTPPRNIEKIRKIE